MMKSFSRYLFEGDLFEAQMDITEDKLKHLEHLEDHPINAGQAGVEHAMNNLVDVHRQLRGRETPTTKITTKYDGSPSIIFGHHPENGKFFVATKSAFNKEPKINYTPQDIEKNHGHAPGLVEKLKSALEHLPKVAPPRGVYQGDVMHTEGDVHHHGYKVSFTPNTITYSAKTSTPQGKAALASKIGVAVHTGYHGDTFDGMKAEYGPDLSHFGQHPDVHLIDTAHNTEGTKYSEDDQMKFKEHFKNAQRLARQIPPEGHDSVMAHQVPLKTYINHTVRNGLQPSYEDFYNHYSGKLQKAIDSVKTPKNKEAKTVEMQRVQDHVLTNRPHFENILALHNELQKAKNVLIDNMSKNPEFEHHIRGRKSKPEGFVVIRNNRPTKFVDRHDFSASNFNRPQDKKEEGEA